ncbi:MAG: polysaccharide deacetylase family protein [Anaerolineae bacterium]|nr:polysaccharide deacetylase family protein [Anaerolineae bacterium]MBT3712110.1 polysaccharide deacetylase family protein [Anaerolineae bacterium]MBT4309503.1 polysaccharide deacetylase family protein [Anaerolineae bacterium]MBT4457279.1 polysaccharide deacetylase family protein [Anaerolineae bacterium]MBT4843014.1 polysaccharide deacetylase family protein [Anaerolineae bacterium]
MRSKNQPHTTLITPRFYCDLRPKKIQAGEVVRVRIKNLGHATEIFSIRGRSRRIKFKPEQESGVKLKSGQSTLLTFQPLPELTLLIGGERSHSFRLEVRSSRGETQILRGKVRHQAKYSIQQVLIFLFLLIFFFYISAKASSSEGFSLFATKTPTPTITPLPTLTPTLAPHHGETLYLTFDDGPSAQWTQQILDILAKYDAKATFFVVGKKAKEHPEVIFAEENAGHSIAHHTWSHVSLNGIGYEGFVRQVDLSNAVLGRNVAPCIRLPYADEGFYTEEYATQLGLEIIWWDVDPFDWSSPGQESIENFVLSNVFSDAIILLHDGGGNRSQTVAALETILKELSLQGYEFDVLCKE